MILNVSAHGLLVRMARPPRIGAVIELRRGEHLIIARTAWTEATLVGLRTQDAVNVAAFAKNGPPVSPAIDSRPDQLVFTRPAASAGWTAERSRQVAQGLQYGALLAAAALAAAVIATTISGGLSRPFQAIGARLPGG